MLQTLIAAGRDRHRLQEIAQVAGRFGLGVLATRFGLKTESDGADDPIDLPRRTRLALEALGPTFVKLGQILATRGDLLPPDWIAEFERLHSSAPTLPFDELRGAVEAALGEPPETAFATFDPQPLAAASMAQVHRATLHDGRAVVLKIRRPGIRPRIEADLRLIAQGAALVEQASVEARRFAPAALVRELAAAMLDECDFTQEGRNADRLRADFAGDSRVVVPAIHWQFTSDPLLVMDYVDGVRPTAPAPLRAAGIDPAAIAALGADVVLDMVLINGRFHADPHPGNLLCLPGNRIVLLDLGMIGHVSPRRREEFVGFVQALQRGDPALLADILAAWSAGADVAPDAIRGAADRLVARHGGQLVLRAIVTDLMAVMRETGLTMPSDLLLIFKALITIDGVLAAIQPDFDLSAALRRASLRIVHARLSADHWGPVAQGLAWELGRIGDDAPRLLRLLVRRLEAEPAVPVAVQPDRAGSRWIAAAILAGAALIAAAGLWG